MYTNARYKKGFSGEICCIVVMFEETELSVPIDPANTDYQNIMRLVGEAKIVIAPAEAT